MIIAALSGLLALALTLRLSKLALAMVLCRARSSLITALRHLSSLSLVLSTNASGRVRALLSKRPHPLDWPILYWKGCEGP